MAGTTLSTRLGAEGGSRLRPYVNRLALVALAAGLLVLPGQAGAQLSAVCDDAEAAQERFDAAGERFDADGSARNEVKFRDAAEIYVELAEACYTAVAGEAATGGAIDDGGVWLDGPHGDGPVSGEYNLFGTKWGAGSPFAGGINVPGPGLPGGTVTFSFMADGVGGLSAEGATGTITALTSLPTYNDCFIQDIYDAFDAWEAISDIQFLEVTDGGGDFNVEAAGDIRIGAHSFDGPSGTLAHGFFPPPNGVTAAGDIHFDIAENWTCVPGPGNIDFGIVALHEIGHAIGMEHESTETAVMNPSYNAVVGALLADDVLAAHETYGSAPTLLTAPVGIGTSTPSEELEVSTDEKPVIKLEDTVGAGGVNSWQIGVNNAGDLFFSDRNGVVQLRVFTDGRIRYQPKASPPSGLSNLGDIYNDTSGALCWYDGSSWTVVGGSGSCT